MPPKVVRLAAALILLLVTTAEAQPPSRIQRIGFLSSTTAEAGRGFFAAFQRGLRELGYVEGKTILIEQRYAAGQFETLPALVAELVRLKVDVLVVGGAPAAHAAKKVTGTIPIVFTYAADPVGTGLVASLARPGGNVTGLSASNPGIVAKRLELLKEVAPSASRVAVLLNPANPTSPLQIKLMQAAAPTLGMTLVTVEVTRADEIDRAFAAIGAERTGPLVVSGDPFFSSHRRKIVDLVAARRIPAIYASRPWVDDGGLISYASVVDGLNHHRAAAYVDKILRGASPADLPVEQPTRFELAINLKAARALGLKVPSQLLMEADHIVK